MCYYLPCIFIRRNYEMVIFFEVYLEITFVQSTDIEALIRKLPTLMICESPSRVVNVSKPGTILRALQTNVKHNQDEPFSH